MDTRQYIADIEKMFEGIPIKEIRVDVCPENLLDAFLHIVEAAEKSNLSETFFRKTSVYVEYASRKLGLSPIQTCLLALFVDKCDSPHICLSEIADYVGCRLTRLLTFSSEMDGLKEKNYLRSSCAEGRLSFSVPLEVIDSLKENHAYVCKGDDEDKSKPLGLIRSDSFPKKQMFYNVSEGNQVDELLSILSVERFGGIQDRLGKSGMRTGFCCLFHGPSGTGKTETVYQIARATGRDIFQVDVDEIKDCWVGESEKNVRGIFDGYRQVCEEVYPEPILLFNEADAIMGVRLEGRIGSVEKMENTIQNIILQEMESMEGIMIATTNLIGNLDKAFERRFLYKIHFEHPAPEISMRIWQSMLPSLTENQAGILSSRFNFSGGEIENVARKCTVKAILSGKDAPDFPSIMEICHRERIDNTSPLRIGFRR